MRAARRALRIDRVTDAADDVAAGGLDPDIRPVVRAGERRRLERLCRRLSRLPLASRRLKMLPDGRMKIIATVRDPEAVPKIRACLGLRAPAGRRVSSTASPWAPRTPIEPVPQ